MAYDKLVDSAKLDGALKSTAAAIRAKTGSTENIPWSETEGFKSAVEGITAGGGSGGSSGIASVAEQSVNIEVSSIAYDATMPSDSMIADMNNWVRNTPASNAYRSIIYNQSDNSNICQYTGVGMFEVIGIPIFLEAGRQYTFQVEYSSPDTLIGDYAEPFAPYLAFLPLNCVNSDADPYPSKYAHTEIGLTVTNYTAYVLQYTAQYTAAGLAAFVMGSTRDDIPVELRLKNIQLSVV